MTTLSLENVVAILGQLAGSFVWFGHAPLACVVADNGRRFDVRAQWRRPHRQDRARQANRLGVPIEAKSQARALRR